VRIGRVPAGQVGVVFRFGQSRPVLGPARVFLIPRIDDLVLFDVAPVTLEIPGARVQLRVTRPLDAATKVVDYREAVAQMTRAALNNLRRTGTVDGEAVRALVDQHVAEWGIRVDRVDLLET